MPPEQAEGATIDARADVYAIGAILYHALSGGPPFRGSASEVIAKLAFGPPPPLPADVPFDLRAIVETAMTRDAAHRYATALELAADLRRCIAGQMVAAHRYTWFERAAHVARRHRAIVMVTAVFACVGIAGALYGVRSVLVERDVAEQERATAEAERVAADEARVSEQRGRAAAEDLVAFMLDDLQSRLGRVGQLALLEDTGDRVEHYYATVDGHDDEQPTQRRVEALVLLGRAQMIRGAGHEAIDSLERAVAAARVLQGSSVLADALRWRAMALRDAGRHDDAAKDLVEARERADIAGGELLRARVRIELARTHVHVSRVDEARDDAVSGLALARLALERHSDDAEAYVLLGAAAVVNATVHALDGKADAAITLLAEVEQTLRARTASDPSDVRVVATLADVLRLHARLEGRRGRGDVARPLSRETLALTERLVAGDPSNLQWQRLLADSVDIDATLSGQANDLDAALAGYRRLVEIRTRIVATNPASRDAQTSLGKAEERVGTAYYGAGKFADAADAFARAELRLGPIAAEGTDTDAAGSLVKTRLQHVDALVELGRTDDAIALARLAVAGAEELQSRHPEHLEHSLRSARALCSLARLLAPGTESEELARRAVVMLRAHDERGQLRNPDDVRMYDEARRLAKERTP